LKRGIQPKCGVQDEKCGDGKGRDGRGVLWSPKKILKIDPDTYTIECKEPAELHPNTNTLGLAWAN